MREVTINKNGWRGVELPKDFTIPEYIVDHQSYVNREKITLYVNEHPSRFLRYMGSDGEEYEADCKGGKVFVKKGMVNNGASEEDIRVMEEISTQFRYFYGLSASLTTKSYGGKSSTRGVLDHKADDILDLFGRLHTVEEVHKIMVQDWKYSISRHYLREFYSRNLKEIDRLRNQYESDYSDLALTKKRGRLDKLSIMFYQYFIKWNDKPDLEVSRELRALLKQIKDEVEGERLQIDFTGRLNVDMTVEINKTMIEATRRIPINNFIVALVAAKKGIDPTKIMAQLTNSYYKSFNGYGDYDPEKEQMHPVDLTYNWNEIQLHQRKGILKDSLEDAKLIESTGEINEDARINTVRKKLLQLIEEDRDQNIKRKTEK